MGLLDDPDLAADIALLGKIMAAVASTAHELTDSEVDEVLGLNDVLPDARRTQPRLGWTDE